MRIFHVNLFKSGKNRQKIVSFSTGIDAVSIFFRSEETWKDVVISDHLTSEQHKEVYDLREKFSDVFSDITDNVVHLINTGNALPIR